MDHENAKGDTAGMTFISDYPTSLLNAPPFAFDDQCQGFLRIPFWRNKAECVRPRLRRRRCSKKESLSIALQSGKPRVLQRVITVFGPDHLSHLALLSPSPAKFLQYPLVSRRVTYERGVRP